MTELETLTYLAGSVDEKIKLLYTLTEKDKIIEVLDLIEKSADKESVRYAKLYLILNPNLPQGIILKPEFKKYITNLRESEMFMIGSYAKEHKPIPSETFQLFFDVYGNLFSTNNKSEKPSSAFHIPYYIKNKSEFSRLNLLTKFVQHKGLDVNLLRPLESLLLEKNKGLLKSILPYILKVSNNSDFLNHYLVKLQKDQNINYTQHHLVANPNLSSEQILFLEKNCLLKPKQKKTLANHPNRKII